MKWRNRRGRGREGRERSTHPRPCPANRCGNISVYVMVKRQRIGAFRVRCGKCGRCGPWAADKKRAVWYFNDMIECKDILDVYRNATMLLVDDHPSAPWNKLNFNRGQPYDNKQTIHHGVVVNLANYRMRRFTKRHKKFGQLRCKSGEIDYRWR